MNIQRLKDPNRHYKSIRSLKLSGLMIDEHGWFVHDMGHGDMGEASCTLCSALKREARCWVQLECVGEMCPGNLPPPQNKAPKKGGRSIHQKPRIGTCTCFYVAQEDHSRLELRQ